MQLLSDSLHLAKTNCVCHNLTVYVFVFENLCLCCCCKINALAVRSQGRCYGLSAATLFGHLLVLLAQPLADLVSTHVRGDNTLHGSRHHGSRAIVLGYARFVVGHGGGLGSELLDLSTQLGDLLLQCGNGFRQYLDALVTVGDGDKVLRVVLRLLFELLL